MNCSNSDPAQAGRDQLRLKNRRFVSLLTALLVFFGAAIHMVDGAGVGTAAAGTRVAGFDSEMIKLVNQARIGAGRVPLTEARGLTSLSVWWSNELANGRTGYQLQHNPDAWEMVTRYGASNRTSWGENVAKFSPSTVPAKAVFDAYMASPGHRANILGAGYRYIGMGTMAGGKGTFNTMTFTDKVEAGQAVAVRGSFYVYNSKTKAPVAGVRYSVRRGSCDISAQALQKTTSTSGAFGMDLVPGSYCAIPTAWAPAAYAKPPRRDFKVISGYGYKITVAIVPL